MSGGLELEVSLLEAEAQLLEELIASGILPPDARREPTAHELRAGVKFADLNRIVLSAAAELLRQTETVRAATLAGLAALNMPADPYEAAQVLDALADPSRPTSLPGLSKVIDEVARQVEDQLIATAEAGAVEAIAEAKRQGIPDDLIAIPDLEAVQPAAATHARRVAAVPARKLLEVAAQAGGIAATRPRATGSGVLSSAIQGAQDASIAAVEDTARQGANVAHGLGRAAGQAALPAPAEVYASELLDNNTCGPCAEVDGRTYVDLEAALVDYPGAGGYVGCDGGSRCRGTLVLVHEREDEATLDNPGHGPTGAPVDRTRRAAADPGRPSHIDDDGNVIPDRRRA